MDRHNKYKIFYMSKCVYLYYTSTDLEGNFLLFKYLGQRIFRENMQCSFPTLRRHWFTIKKMGHSSIHQRTLGH
jgi:hypothetical protein